MDDFDTLLEKFLPIAFGDNPELADEFLTNLTDEGRWKLIGYIKGYTDACRHIEQMEQEAVSNSST